MALMDSSADEVSSSELACCEAPSATVWLDEAIWPAAADTWSTAPATWARDSCNAAAVWLTDSLILAWSPR